MLRGVVTFAIGDRLEMAEAGRAIDVPPGVVHDCWNAADQEARVRVEMSRRRGSNWPFATAIALRRTGGRIQRACPPSCNWYFSRTGLMT